MLMKIINFNNMYNIKKILIEHVESNLENKNFFIKILNNNYKL
jgi:hypothetical protein